MTVLSSSSGYLSMLDDPELSIQEYGLQQLEQLVDKFWPEIATQIPKMSDTQ